jgi:hypothetical protein
LEAYQEADLGNYRKLQLERTTIVKWLNLPFFVDAIKDKYVKVNVGKVNGMTSYAMAKISGINEGKSYDIDIDNKKRNIKVYLDLTIGRSTRKQQIRWFIFLQF